MDGHANKTKTAAENWLKVSIHHPPAAADALTSTLFDEGAQGLWEDRPDSNGRLVTRAGFEVGRAGHLKSVLPELLAGLAEAFEYDPAEFEFSIELEENQDWAEKWKEGLEPFIAGPSLAVAPSWWPENDLPEAGTVLRLDPGLAFGSGHHATTFLCLRLLTELAPEARRILDVGSGSGILSLAAAALNHKAEIFGIDNDSTTIAVADENAEINRLAGRIRFSDDELSALTPPFDLIVANITLMPLLELAPAISALSETGGRLVLSGLLDTQVDEAAQAYKNLGWGLKRRLGRDEWAALALTKGGEPLQVERETV